MSFYQNRLCLRSLLLACALAACTRDEARTQTAECETDGECAEHWRCDYFAKSCRCVNDEGCNASAKERCMPDGVCRVRTGCARDEDCAACQACELVTGECLCNDDCGCSAGETCNDNGYCQTAVGCADNADCLAGTFCDVPSASCIDEGTCTADYQCPIGSICSVGSCILGCRNYGDCPLRWVCNDSGVCAEEGCGGDAFCGFMELCIDTVCTNQYNEDNAPYCEPCSASTATVCGDGNRCLVYPYTNDDFGDHYSSYCGVDCSEGQRCPNGFACRTMLAPAETSTCRDDNDCPGSLTCIKGEGADTGFCPCDQSDNPCVDFCTTDDICAYAGGYCSGDWDCPDIACVQSTVGNYKVCVLAKSCGLAEGYHCPYN